MIKYKLHDIPRHIVKTSVREKVKRAVERYKVDKRRLLITPQSYYVNQSKKLSDRIREINFFRNKKIKEEYRKYAKVKVMEVEGREKPFYLVYSQEDINRGYGTGGFSTYKDAVDWFARNGR